MRSAGNGDYGREWEIGHLPAKKLAQMHFRAVSHSRKALILAHCKKKKHAFNSRPAPKVRRCLSPDDLGQSRQQSTALPDPSQKGKKYEKWTELAMTA